MTDRSREVWESVDLGHVASAQEWAYENMALPKHLWDKYIDSIELLSIEIDSETIDFYDLATRPSILALLTPQERDRRTRIRFAQL